MGLMHSPNIVRSGLILYLDAANTKSYPGSGTTWTDLSGNAKTGTLTNGPTFSASNNGGFVFDGTNDYAVMTNSFSAPSLPTGSSSRTLIAIFRATALAGAYAHILHYGSSNTDQAFGLTLLQVAGSYYLSNHTWSGTSYMSTTAIAANTTYFGAVVFDNATSPKNRFYLNGTLGTTAFGQGKAADYAINTGTAYQLLVGTRIFTPAEYFTGSIFCVQAYDRALSAAEVSQNFNALRGRYGV